MSIIAIPVSKSDVSLLRPLVEAMIHFGGLEDYPVYFFPSHSVKDDAIAIAPLLAEKCKEVRVIPINLEPEGGWPQACNQHFSGVLEKLKEMKNAEDLLWLEADCCPTKPDWAKTIFTTHAKAGKKFSGVIRDTKEVMPGADGRHMVAAGAVWPHDFYEMTRLWQYTPSDQPWDVWCRWEIAPKAVDSLLVQHCPKTFSYFRTKDNGILRGFPEKGASDSLCAIRNETVLVHGCKDGSLSKVVCCGKESKPKEEAPSKIQKQSNEAQGATAHDLSFLLSEYPDNQCSIRDIAGYLKTSEWAILSASLEDKETFRLSGFGDCVVRLSASAMRSLVKP